MPLDSYAQCPGGLDKKVKFCCPDLTAELEKLQRMIDGDQRLAALDLIEKLESKYPNRPCLLSYKIGLLADAQREEELKATVDRFVEQHPDNPIALAEASLFTAHEKGIEAGIAQLQAALERVGRLFPRPVYDALGTMAVAALSGGRPIAAVSHLLLQAALDPKDEAPIGLIGRIMASPSIPILMKDEHPIVPAPESTTWKQQFEAALSETSRGHWRSAADQFQTLANRSPDPAAALQNEATLRCRLADNPRAVAALRKYAALQVPLDNAVEAEALAQLLDSIENQPTIDLVSLEYQINDIDRLGDLLASSDRATRTNVEPKQPDEPPPRAAFVLLDRPMPDAAGDLQLNAIPSVLATVLLYGRQTDRDARAELIAYRTQQLDQARELLSAIAGDTIGAAGGETVIERVPAHRHALTANWRLPDGVSPDRVRELTSEFRCLNLLERWPRLPLPVLDGKSAMEVKGDPSYQVRLAAAVLQLELSSQQEGSELDFTKLRSELGLPVAAPIDPTTIDVATLPLARYGRVEIQKLNDDQLIALYWRSARTGLRTVARNAALQIVGRDGIDAKIDLDEVYPTLIYTSTSSDSALQFIDRARDWAVKKGRSSVTWDLEELNLRVIRMEGDEVTRLLNHITREHINEPGVREAVTELLYAVGAIGPDGRPTRAASTNEPAVAAQATAEAGKIWTPDDAAPGEQKSKLWVPGRD